jgi:hypothetical protein
MQSTSVRQGDGKASAWVAGLAFAVAAFALFHGPAGIPALLLATCGFSLLFKRLRQNREALDAELKLPEELARGRELLRRGATRHSLSLSHAVAEQAHSAQVQQAALELVAWCELSRGRPSAARDALSWAAGSPTLDPYCRAAVEDGCGQSLWALHIIERAARRRVLSREATMFRIDLYARLRGVEAACTLTLLELSRLDPEDPARVLEFARNQSAEGKAIAALADAVARQATRETSP